MGQWKWPSKIVFNINVANCIVEFDLLVSISKHMLDPVLTALISKTFLTENTHCSFRCCFQANFRNSKNAVKEYIPLSAGFNNFRPHPSFHYSKQPKHNGLGNQDFKYEGFLLIVMRHDSCQNLNSN